jgi:hypothetical protein
MPSDPLCKTKWSLVWRFPPNSSLIVLLKKSASLSIRPNLIWVKGNLKNSLNVGRSWRSSSRLRKTDNCFVRYTNFVLFWQSVEFVRLLCQDMWSMFVFLLRWKHWWSHTDGHTGALPLRRWILHHLGIWNSP